MAGYVLVMVAFGFKIAVGMLGYGLDWFKSHRLSPASYEAGDSLERDVACAREQPFSIIDCS